MTAALATSPSRRLARRALSVLAPGVLIVLATVFSLTVPSAHAQKAQHGKSARAKPAASEPAAAPAAPATGTITPTTSGPVQVAEVSSIPVPAIAARAWISIDAVTGQVVASFNPDMKIEPASLTKIMTAYVAFNALKQKRLTLDQDINVSQSAWKTRGSRMFIEPRKPVSVDELLKGMIIQSGNDASVAIAEAVAGSEAAYATMMNQQAQALGMTNTNFVNVTGLPDPEHVTTVRDLSTLARHMILDHAEYFP